ncbi:MAG: hypothetical protein IPJ65_31995 [Archangiaceae bacterium]|nr:hypothetical protein [Archangiaceae bacterium]
MLRHSLLALALLGTGCSLDRVLLDGQLAATRKASSSFDTLADLEVAKIGAGSSLVQLEGMHVLAPDQQDALFLLLNGYTGYASAFVEDEWEQAYDRGDDDAEAAAAERAKQNYDRALSYGTELMERVHPGFQAAQKNRDTIKAYLQQWTKEDAETVLWMGVAWMSRGGVAAERPEIVAELFIGEALLERANELDDSLAYSLGLAALAAYHARSPDAELAVSKELFAKAEAKTQRKALTPLVLHAQNLSCVSHDEKEYRALLAEVLAAPDFPAQRLENTIAKRKAQRYLGAPRLKRCSF